MCDSTSGQRTTAVANAHEEEFHGGVATMKTSSNKLSSRKWTGWRMASCNTYWITLYGFLIFSTSTVVAAWGQSDFTVHLKAEKYVERGKSLKLHCNNNVKPDILYKVTWLKNGNKIFEYINGRTPPFRNFTIPGAVIDWKQSNEQQLTLQNVDFEAAGGYSCEVSTDTPIFSRESEVDIIHVILPQREPPKISFSKRQFYIGENLVANCTTSRARPTPHITWLINGKKVDDKHIKMLHPYASAAGGKANHRPKTQSHPGNNLDWGVGGGSSSPDVDIVDAHFPITRTMTDPTKGFNNDQQRRMNSRMERIENYPHYRSFVDVADEDNVQEDNIYGELDGGDYQRVVFDEDAGGLVHTKHLKYKRNRSGGYVNRRHVNEAPRIVHKPVVASSQLVVEVSELHADANGRLEITCLATIPAHVGPGEQFADYKTYSVKIDVEQNEVTTAAPQPAKLDNFSSSSSSSLALAQSSCKLWQREHLAQVALTLFLIFFNLKWRQSQ